MNLCYSCKDYGLSCDQCSSTTCLTCINNGYILIIPNINCTKCNISYPFCDTCDTISCLTCISGYTLSIPPNPSCQLCSSTIAGCLVCTDPATCTSCDLNGNFSNTINSGKCSCNNDTFVLIGAICSLCSNQITGCLNCNEVLPSVYTCTFCDNSNNYVLTIVSNYNNCTLCKDLISNCISCVNTGVCKVCDYFYGLDLSTNNATCKNCSNAILGC